MAGRFNISNNFFIDQSLILFALNIETCHEWLF